MRIVELGPVVIHCKKYYVKSTKFGFRYITSGMSSQFFFESYPLVIQRQPNLISQNFCWTTRFSNVKATTFGRFDITFFKSV